jgi:hypothetical protein
VRGTITTDVALVPMHLAFGEVSTGEGATRALTVDPREDRGVTVTAVTIDDPRFEINKKSDSDGKAEYEVEFLGSKKAERIQTKLHVAARRASREVYSAPVKVSVIGDLRYPSRVVFLKRGGTYSLRRIFISSRSGRTVRVKRLEDKGGLLELAVAEESAKGIHVIAQVDADKLKDEAELENKLIVRTDHPDEPRIEIDYLIRDPKLANALRRSPGG